MTPENRLATLRAFGWPESPTPAFRDGLYVVSETSVPPHPALPCLAADGLGAVPADAVEDYFRRAILMSIRNRAALADAVAQARAYVVAGEIVLAALVAEAPAAPPA